jgi:GDPmannose 4,6-dehydratase
MRRALITGIGGMDGSHLADLLLEKGYEVFGLVRRSARPPSPNLDYCKDRITLLHGDLCDESSLHRAVAECEPHEVYNLAAQSFVGASWELPLITADITGLGVGRMLEAVRTHAPDARFYQASSSEMFGDTDGFLDEQSHFKPRSPYGVAKAFGHNLAVNYRESHGMHVSCGILFNHESERRGLEFVTRKITHRVAEIKLGLADCLSLGALTPQRDWGYAPDYVQAMWLMLQRDEPDDYVIATGECHSVQEFAEEAFGDWDWAKYTTTSDALRRPAEIAVLRGDSSKALSELGWKPTVEFEEIVARMVEHDLALCGDGRLKACV